VCSHVFESKKGFQDHFKHTHRGQTFVEPIIVKAQRLYKNPGLMQLFEVDENIETESENEFEAEQTTVNIENNS